jgi:predicted RNase H-like HicB family nuclease
MNAFLGDEPTPVSTFTAVLHKEGDLYVAECPEVRTVSQGETVEAAVDNLKEATESYLEEFPPEKPGREHTKEAITKRRNPR